MLSCGGGGLLVWSSHRAPARCRWLRRAVAATCRSRRGAATTPICQGRYTGTDYAGGCLHRIISNWPSPSTTSDHKCISHHHIVVGASKGWACGSTNRLLLSLATIDLNQAFQKFLITGRRIGVTPEPHRSSRRGRCRLPARTLRPENEKKHTSNLWDLPLKIKYGSITCR